MKATICILAGALGLSSAAFAGPTEDLLKAKNCMACHSVAAKIVGPAYKDVAAKYKGDKAAADKLAIKIQKGGAGVWGQVPMPPNAVSVAEAKQLATWVLSQK